MCKQKELQEQKKPLVINASSQFLTEVNLGQVQMNPETLALKKTENDRFEKIVQDQTDEEKQMALLKEGIQLSEWDLNENDMEAIVSAPRQEKPPVQHDATATLSSSERRKLQSRQRSDLTKARESGIPGATGDTLAYINSMKAANEELFDNPGKIDMLVGNLEDSGEDVLEALTQNNLFAENYETKNDPPHNMLDIKTHIATAKLLIERGSEGFSGPLTLEKRAEYAGLEELVQRMEAAEKAVVESNGVGLNGYMLTAEQTEAARVERAKAVADYTAFCRNATLTKTAFACQLLGQPEYAETQQQVQAELAEAIENKMATQLKEDRTYWKNLPQGITDIQLASLYTQKLKLFAQNPQMGDLHDDAASKLLDSLSESATAVSKIHQQVAQITKLEKAGQLSSTETTRMQEYLLGNEAYRLHTQNISLYAGCIDALFGVENIPLEYHKYIYETFSINTSKLTAEKDRIAALKDQEYEAFLKEKPEPGKEKEFIHQRIKRRLKRKDNVENDLDFNPHPINYVYKHPYGEKIDKSGLDKRMLKAFLPGYDVNEKTGEPLSLNDRKQKAEAEQFAKDITSGDKNKIRPILLAALQQAINYIPQVDILSDKTLPEKISDIIEESDRVIYSENLFKNFPWFYKELDGRVRLLLAKGDDTIAGFCTALALKVTLLGTELSTGRKHAEMSAEELEEVTERFESMAESSKLQCANYIEEASHISRENLLQQFPEQGKEDVFVIMRIQNEIEYNKGYDVDLVHLHNGKPEACDQDKMLERLRSLQFDPEVFSPENNYENFYRNVGDLHNTYLLCSQVPNYLGGSNKALDLELMKAANAFKEMFTLMMSNAGVHQDQIVSYGNGKKAMKEQALTMLSGQAENLFLAPLREASVNIPIERQAEKEAEAKQLAEEANKKKNAEAQK